MYLSVRFSNRYRHRCPIERFVIPSPAILNNSLGIQRGILCPPPPLLIRKYCDGTRYGSQAENHHLSYPRDSPSPHSVDLPPLSRLLQRSFVRSIDRRVRSTDEVSTRGGGGTIRLPREKRVALYTRMDANERASHTRSDRYAVSSFLSSLLFYRSVHTPPIITYIYRSSERGRSSSDTGRGGRARYPPFADGRIPGHRDACTDGAELAAAPSRASERSPPRIASPRIAQAQDASCCPFLPPPSLHFPLPLSLSFSFFRTTLRAVRCIIFNLLSRSFDAWGRGGSGPFGETWGEEGDRDGEIETRVFLFSALLLDDKR